MVGRVLVTGADGFIGRHVVADLQRRGYESEAYVADVRDRIVADEKCDVVVHLAGVTPARDGSDSAKDVYDVNVAGTYSVLRYCDRVGARLLLASTSAVYGVSQDATALAESADVDPRTPYALSKWLAEGLCRSWSADTGGQVVVLRLFNVYGNGQRSEFIVPYIVDCVRNTSPIRLRSPQAIRDFVHVDDVVAAVRLAISQDLSGYTVFNVGSGVGVSVADLAATAVDLGGKAVAIEVVGTGQSRDAAVAESSAAQSRLGWRAEIDLREGLQRLFSE